MEIKGKVHCFFEQSKEEWRDIKGFEGLYQVSNLGNIKSLSREVRANTCGVRELPEKILTKCVSSCGYYIVVLCKKGKHYTKLIHRLVAEAFIPNPRKLNEVNHKDENKLNNISINLEWCDRFYNANYGTGVERCARQKHKSVAMINAKTGETICVYESARIANKETGISYKGISSVCNGRTKTAGGYFWKFI